ncbi:MAG TPA: hypothetical protein VK191_09715 [Symbiobacteriaceae bacterium]|nr:hypothetical protein [Symbiobacteriaceae bacterium]
MLPESQPKAEPRLWQLIALGGILAIQIALLQIALNRLVWGYYPRVYAPAVWALVLSGVSWLLYSFVDREQT